MIMHGMTLLIQGCLVFYPRKWNQIRRYAAESQTLTKRVNWKVDWFLEALHDTPIEDKRADRSGLTEVLIMSSKMALKKITKKSRSKGLL